MTVRKLDIRVPDEDLADLHARLARTRWPGAIEGAEWAQGTDDAFLRTLVDRWRDGFDWRAQEAQLNSVSNFVTELDGLAIHFVHKRGKGPRRIPLLLGHGCYSNFYEFHKVIGPLTDPGAFGGDPNDSFDVVVWSLPGFGYSGRPVDPGWNVDRMAGAAHQLMSTLGYDRYGAMGGSWGGLVAARAAFRFSEAVIGLFLTQASPPATPLNAAGSPPLTRDEEQFLSSLAAHRGEETGYASLLRTRPQSIAYALNDSPAGLAGWVAEKLRAWSDCDGELGSTFTLDEVLTSISLTWFTGTVGSGQRLYYENAHGDWDPAPGEVTGVPTGVLGLPGGIPHERVPPETIRRRFNLTHYSMAARGGDYPALEVPEVLVENLREFFRPLREAAPPTPSPTPKEAAHD